MRAKSGLSRSWTAPAVLLAPAGVVLAGVLGYPLVRLLVNSFQDYGLRALFTGTTRWIGVANYTAIFTDPQFGPVLLRTGVFTLSLVVGCLVIGMLMTRLPRWLRMTLNVLLILAWALPTVSSTLVWQWLFQPVYGVVNWLITQVGWFGDYTSHRWTGTAGGAFTIVWLLITWQSVPFVALTLSRARRRSPASTTRRRRPARRPAARPGLRDRGGDRDPAHGRHRRVHPPAHPPGRGAVSTRRRPKRPVAFAGGIVCCLVWAVPIYWMLNTSFKTRDHITTTTPRFLPVPFSVGNYVDAFTKPGFQRNLVSGLSAGAVRG